MNEKAGAVVALALYAIFGGVGFGWRSWLQWRNTGSTGFRGVSGRPGSPEWFGGVGLVIAVVITVAAPILQLAGIVAPLGFLRAEWIQVAGIGLALAGIGATVYAQVDMGDSWRIGVDDSETTTLVNSGVFGFVRNPIFLAMFVFWFGVVLVTPNIVAIVGYLLVLSSIELQVRVVEEPYLLNAHGDSYRDYAGRVGRFLPGVGLIR
jgi:protein-S-isoprenylcysteine O-methyltransferase Ste14